MIPFNLAGFLLSLAAAAALLIWSVRLVRTGVERAFGRQLRSWMARSGRSKVMAAGSGVAAALMLQSATAVLALLASFSAGISPAVGTAILLGADLGSALVVRLISLHISDMMPVLLLMGVALFLKGGTSELRQSGRILIGLGLIFVSLDMIRDAAAPLVGHTGAKAALTYLAQDALSAFVIGALLAWLVHSSVATVLLVVTLAGNGLLDGTGAATIVLGANFGSCLIALGLTLNASSTARAMVYANLIARGGGAVLALALFQAGLLRMDVLGHSPALAAVNLHIAFNAAVLLVFLPVTAQLTRLATGLSALFITRPSQPLDRLPDPAEFVGAPERALPRLRRALLHMGEMVAAMHHRAGQLLFEWDSADAAQLVTTAKDLRTRHAQIKLFVAELHGLPAQDGAQPIGHPAFAEITQIGAAIEGAASVLAGDVLVIARSLAGQETTFSPRGRDEIRSFIAQIADNIDIALQVLERENLGAATDLIERKAQIRDQEQKLLGAHMIRLSQRLSDSLATSSQHQDSLRSFKLINSYMAQIGSCLLERHGQMQPTRIADL